MPIGAGAEETVDRDPSHTVPAPESRAECTRRQRTVSGPGGMREQWAQQRTTLERRTRIRAIG